MEKNIFVSDLEPDKRISSIFVVTDKEIKPTKTGNLFIKLILSDKTGSVTGKIWESSGIEFNKVPTRGPVAITGRTELFRDALQVIVEKIEPIDSQRLRTEDFLPSLEESIVKKLFRELKGNFFTSLECKWCRKLWMEFLGRKELVRSFCRAPAAVWHHHAYIGGLLEHTYSVLKLVDLLCTQYPELNRDLLCTGALFHDIGKTKEYTYDWAIGVSDEGRLMGHLVLGVQMVQELISSIKGFPADKAMVILHMILSHHGQAEYGAVKLPMTMEALALHFADDLDAKMNKVKKLYDETPEGERWTAGTFDSGIKFFVFPQDLDESYEVFDEERDKVASVPRQLGFDIILKKN